MLLKQLKTIAHKYFWKKKQKEKVKEQKLSRNITDDTEIFSGDNNSNEEDSFAQLFNCDVYHSYILSKSKVSR